MLVRVPLMGEITVYDAGSISAVAIQHMVMHRRTKKYLSDDQDHQGRYGSGDTTIVGDGCLDTSQHDPEPALTWESVADPRGREDALQDVDRPVTPEASNHRSYKGRASGLEEHVP